MRCRCLGAVGPLYGNGNGERQELRARDVNERFKELHERAEAAVMRLVAEQLGNTAAVARRSYVDSRVCEAFRKGRAIDLDGDTSRDGLERATRRLLTT